MSKESLNEDNAFENRRDLAVPVERRVMRPGNGWKHLGGAVYEYINGVRLHMQGFAKTPDGEHISANAWPEYETADLFIRINGNNRKRGLMAWAKNLDL